MLIYGERGRAINLEGAGHPPLLSEIYSTSWSFLSLLISRRRLSILLHFRKLLMEFPSISFNSSWLVFLLPTNWVAIFLSSTTSYLRFFGSSLMSKLRSSSLSELITNSCQAAYLRSLFYAKSKESRGLLLLASLKRRFLASSISGFKMLLWDAENRASLPLCNKLPKDTMLAA